MDIAKSEEKVKQANGESMLASVEIILRTSPALQDLEANCRLITKFLGPPPNMSLRDGCVRGSIKLLEWIWDSSCASVEDRVPRWTLTNYLRSEPYYYSYQFSMALSEAAGQGNLDIVKWLFRHFSSCKAHDSVAYTAAKNGHLHVLQFLWAYTDKATTGETPPSKKRKVVECGSGACAEGASDNHMIGSTHSVDWNYSCIVVAAEHGHFDIVRWLYEATPMNMYAGMYDRAIRHILRVGNDELVQLLLPPGRCVLDYAEGCPRPEVI